MIFKPRATDNYEFCNTSQLPCQTNAAIMILSINCSVFFFFSYLLLPRVLVVSRAWQNYRKYCVMKVDILAFVCTCLQHKPYLCQYCLDLLKFPQSGILISFDNNLWNIILTTVIPIYLCRAIMTHASVPKDQRIALGISDTLVSLNLTNVTVGQ